MTRTVCILSFVLLCSSVQAQNVKADSIVNLHFKSVGGKNAWKELKTFYIVQAFFTNHESTSSNNSFLQSQSALELQKTYYQYPDQYRAEFYMNGVLVGTFLTDSSKAKVNMGGYEEKWGNQKYGSLSGNTQFYVIGPTLLMLGAAEKGNIAYEGLVEAYGKECHKLVFVAKEFTGRLVVYLDTTTHLIHASSNVNFPHYKVYSDYRRTKGLVIPHKFSSYEEDKLYEEYAILEIEVNQKIEDHLFKVWQ